MEPPRKDQPAQIVMTGRDDKQEGKNVDLKPAEFEEAVAATGYGKFHYLLYLAAIPASWASGFDTSTTSMIIPAAECDLNLTLKQKGIVNAAIYGGMVSSALMWGFIADSFGRKPVVFYGYLVDGILNLLSGLSQNFWVLIGFKFVCGFIVSGPYASVMTYTAEFHCTKDRPKITMLVGFMITAGSIVGAALALLVIPQYWTLYIGSFEMHSWQIYLSLCGVPVLFGVACLAFFPESPKFLMSQGNNQAALKVFRKMYSCNTGESQKNYPIKVLKNEVVTQSTMESNELKPKRDLKACVREGLLQMKPLFLGSYFLKLMLVVTIQFCGMLCTNTIRLWQPQLFAIIEESNRDHNEAVDFSFCSVIDQSTGTSLKNESISKCIHNLTEGITYTQVPVDNSVYTNTIIISASSLFFTFLAGVLVSMIKNKHLLLICYFVAACSVLALNWSRSMMLTLILISLFVGCLSASVNLVISVVVNVFPTTMRTMAVSLTMMCGRIGSLIGNVLFPVFLGYGCTTSLFSLAAIVTAAFILTLFVPKPKEGVK